MDNQVSQNHTSTMFRDFLLSRVTPFKNGNFSAFFFVQTLSSVGRWSHDLARAWIVVELLGKAGALGGLLFAAAIPSLFLILQGGVIVDRVDVRRLMTFTKLLLAFASMVLALIYYTSGIEFWHLLIFAAIEGSIMAFDSPAFQALTVRLVPREDFQQALALNSVNFHLSRALGPVVAGVLMAWKGPAAVFLFDGLSYLLLSYILTQISLRQATIITDKAKNSLSSLKEGFAYFYSTPNLRYKLIQLLMAVAIMFPILIVIFRTYLAAKFQLNDAQFGYLFALPAFGSSLGSISFAILKPSKPLRALWVGVPCTAIGTIAVVFAPNIYFAGALMFLNGFATYLSFVSLTVSLHLDVKEEFRGRLSSLIGMGFLSIGPLMSFPMGHLSDIFGYQNFVALSALAYFGISVLLFFVHWKTWEAPTPVEESSR